MAFYDKFPYTNFQEINLDRLIHELIQVKDGLNFVIENASLKYADPIQWNITHQYQANTVVIDPETGIAYISTKPVPDNVSITDTNYWTPIFDLSELFNDIETDIGNLENGLNTANTNIAANTAAIGTNTDAISANTAAIGTNTDAISANTTAIGNNTESIADINADLLLNVPENAKLHGVVGDGITDDTTALQQVLNDYAWVYLPPGEYLVSSTIILPNKHRLSGTHSAVIKCASSLTHVIDLRNESTLEHLDVKCGSADRSLMLRNYTKVNDVHIYDSVNGIQVGLSNTTTTGAYMTDCLIYDFMNTGIEFYQSNDCYFSNCIWNAGATHTNANDCYMNTDIYCEAHTFVNCSFLNGARSLVIAGDSIRFNRFTNCYFDSSTQVFLNAGASNTFTNCWFSNRGGNGVLLGGIKDTTFEACTFGNCSPYGIRSTGGTDGLIINGCTFFACATAATYINSSTRVIMTNNNFSDYSLSTTQPTPAAFGADPANGIITGNILKSQGNVPTAMTNRIVANNLILS